MGRPSRPGPPGASVRRMNLAAARVHPSTDPAVGARPRGQVNIHVSRARPARVRASRAGATAGGLRAQRPRGPRDLPLARPCGSRRAAHPPLRRRRPRRQPQRRDLHERQPA
ncbi:hypothetical protein FTX61_20040 [Nitriliruptoraceae bacterium ZYF776]|nr:hypothetical protein [Profundirhabdus halotolerans]